MTRSRWFILLLGLALGVVAYACLYFGATAQHRHMMRQPDAELVWLKNEFSLSDADCHRIVTVHNGYLPRCEEMCRRIATKNAELKTILAKSDNVTGDIQKKISEIADLKAQCQTQMLQHFFDVSRAMPPAQGQRYLQWIENKTLLHCDANDTMAEMQ
jgi:hypothetical protein